MTMSSKIRKIEKLHDGREDGLSPLEPLDIRSADSVGNMLAQMEHTAFGARRLGEAVDVLIEMIQDPKALVVGTFSGAMTIAKMGRLICDMIDWGWLDVIISTGALMAHGLVESAGMVHYKVDPSANDRELYLKGYNRVYDTLEMEANLNDAEVLVSQVISQFPPEEVLSSEIICRAIGKHLHENFEGPGILKNAYENKVPVYIPAFTDSELALDCSCHRVRELAKRHPDWSWEQLISQASLNFNPFLDLLSYTQLVSHTERIGIFTIGGGVPRNWAQQVGPHLNILEERTGVTFPQKRFHYGLRICPEPVHWGGLSGCTYSEAVSWGKFIPPAEGGRFAEVLCDATIAWPLVARAAAEKLGLV